ncbi:MAG TPA: hypothetical protein VFR55_00810 [Dehalococcoidia bacterium]|nr:hypothetical protein [Dehalococcoidia bacterium]
MPLEFGVFDHIEPVPGLPLNEIYRLRLQQLERLDSAGFYAYHLAEHHTPAVHTWPLRKTYSWRQQPNALSGSTWGRGSTFCPCTIRCV